MATCDWDQEKKKQFEQADASQNDAWFATNWSLHPQAMSDHAVESFPTCQWKSFRKWLKKQDDTSNDKEQQEGKEKLLDMLDQLERADDHLLKADDEIQHNLALNPPLSMADLLSGPNLFQMMDHTSRGQAPPQPVPLPQLGPGEEFEMTLQMVKDDDGLDMFAKMIPTIVKKNGKKYRMNPDGTASSDEIL